MLLLDAPMPVTVWICFKCKHIVRGIIMCFVLWGMLIAALASHALCYTYVCVLYHCTVLGVMVVLLCGQCAVRAAF
jgi:hypothetical protein